MKSYHFLALGLTTGVITIFIQPFGGIWIDDIESAIRTLSSPILADLFELFFTFAPGLLLGAVIGFGFHKTQNTELWKWLVFSCIGATSWYFAISSAIHFGGDIPVALLSDEVSSGIVGGFVGSVLLLTGSLWIYPFTRQPQHIILVIVCGSVIGALLGVELLGGYHLLFPIWQGTIAYLYGRTISNLTNIGSSKPNV